MEDRCFVKNLKSTYYLTVWTIDKSAIAKHYIQTGHMMKENKIKLLKHVKYNVYISQTFINKKIVCNLILKQMLFNRLIYLQIFENIQLEICVSEDYIPYKLKLKKY